MRASDCLRYLFGHRQAIEAVAKSRAALAAGIILVLLTSIARNYDQTWLPENPFLWIFGSLLFSWVSGSVLYAVAWRGMVRRSASPKLPETSSIDGWVCFMGLFWLTAPIAWLYAIPVERFLDDVAAAKANVALLATVSLWRVLLMARVLHVLSRAPFLLVLLWVLMVAAAEALVVFFFGGGFAKAIMAGMGGMRNSPAEEILIGAMGTAFSGAFFTFPIALLCVLVWPRRYELQPLPALTHAPLPWKLLLVAAIFWIAVAILPQRELAHTVAYQRLIEAGQYRQALDYLSARGPGDFASARPLPPAPYERDSFGQLFQLIAVANERDASWTHQHLVHRLGEMASQMVDFRWRRRASQNLTQQQKIENLKMNVRSLDLTAQSFLDLLDGLNRFPEGRAWLAGNTDFLVALSRVAKEPPEPRRTRRPEDTPADSTWTNVILRLTALGITNQPSTNAPP